MTERFTVEAVRPDVVDCNGEPAQLAWARNDEGRWHAVNDTGEALYMGTRLVMPGDSITGPGRGEVFW